METSKILTADLLDIIFEGKNKEYGAYELRKTYKRRLLTSMAGMVIICMIFFLSTLLAKNDHGKNVITVKDYHLEDYKQKEEVKVVKPPAPLPKPLPVQVEIKRFTNFNITVDELVNEPPPRQVDLDGATIGTIDVHGIKYDDYVSPPVEPNGTGKVEPLKNVTQDYEEKFTKVEKEAMFPGGAAAWKKYLERNLNAQVAADDGALAGNYTVIVQFIVDKEGVISDVTAIDIPKACPGCGPEAVKVIKKGPRWEPAVQNGRAVKFQAVQHITFHVEE